MDMKGGDTQMNKTQLVSACQDLFGYSSDDFDGMTKGQVFDCLTDGEQEQVEAYTN